MNDDLHFLADVPHLLKNLRAAFCKGFNMIIPDNVVKKHRLPSNTATVSHLQVLHKFQEKLSLRIAPRLREKDIDPKHFDKMSVGSAMRVFSNDVAAGLKYLVEECGYDKSLLTTAWFVGSVRKWFDLMTSRHVSLALSLKNQEAYTTAINFLSEFKGIIRDIKIGEKGHWKPVQTGIILSTTSILEIQERLLNEGLPFLLTSRFSQDKLENFFSCIRQRNSTPTAYEFKKFLKIVTIAQYMHEGKGSNYQQDEARYLADFLSVKKELRETDSSHDEEDSEFLVNLMTNFPGLRVSYFEQQNLYYLTGYVIHSFLRRSKGTLCEDCVKGLTMNPWKMEENPFMKVIKLKDYTGDSLKYCDSNVFEKLILPAEKIFQTMIKSPGIERKKKMAELMTECTMKTTEDVLKKCHEIKKKFIRRFFTIRLKICAHDFTTLKQNDQRNENIGTEKGSRSMAMRKIVDEIK